MRVRLMPATMLVLYSITSANAQETRGAIFGRIADQQNSAIPEATVLVTNADTNTAMTLSTNETGYYEANAGWGGARADGQGRKRMDIPRSQFPARPRAVLYCEFFLATSFGKVTNKTSSTNRFLLIQGDFTFSLPRREFLKQAGVAADAQTALRAADANARCSTFSPWLYMRRERRLSWSPIDFP